MTALYFTFIGEKEINYRIEELPFTEEGILKGCIKYFDDEHPCFIHRSAVKARYITELEDYIIGHYYAFPVEIEIASLPQEIVENINVTHIQKIRILNKEDST